MISQKNKQMLIIYISQNSDTTFAEIIFVEVKGSLNVKLS